MSDLRVKRRSFLETLPAIQVGLLAEQQKVQPSAVGVKVTAGVDRFNDVRKLPGGDLLYACAARPQEDNRQSAQMRAAIVPVYLRGVVRPVGTALLRYPRAGRARLPPRDVLLRGSMASAALLDARFGRLDLGRSIVTPKVLYKRSF